ncbi:elongation factor-2 kinase-like protein [Leptomonas seymouri]|uniref:Elongation factor-2 kinase-like protein n=1 Tax=Leptomonas seymouri TaxID=5684 RepID=A0A0N1PEM2_LEPSE|nr:elongation factor-2 kinase-like protein [Leptomonas seymouri]|eukprot:KPI89020.1 elongation factor-2 kinase-like protein [Leptomonas seymouri]
MPSREVSLASQPDCKPNNSDARKKKKTGRKSKSPAVSPSILALPQQCTDPAERTNAFRTQGSLENISHLAAPIGCGSCAGSKSLESVSRVCSRTTMSPDAFLVLNPVEEGFQPRYGSPNFIERLPTPGISASSSPIPFCTLASTSPPSAYMDPMSDELHPHPKGAANVKGASSCSGGGPIRKKAVPRCAATSQPEMFSTSPANISLEREPTPSPQEAALTKVELQQSVAASTAAIIKKQKTRSPQLQAPWNYCRMDTDKVLPAAASTAANTPPSPRPREPQEKQQVRDVKAKANAWSPSMNTHENPEYLPTDAPNIVVPACKYSYDVRTCTWKSVDTMIRVLHPNRGVSQGAMRVCFVVDELDEHGFSTPMVAKMFRHNWEGIVEADYFNEGEAQCISDIFADKFNKIEVPKEVDRFVISFLQCSTVRIRVGDLPEEYQTKRTGFFSYRTTDTRDIVFTMEPRLKGNFTKYTNNYGGVYDGFEQRLDREEEQRRHKVLMAVEAFSHFALEDSGGSMLVCDLQGVNDFLTDPQIHTEDGKGLGMGNMGQKGIDKWMEMHVCNDMCRALKLTPLKDWKVHPPPTLNLERRVSYYKILRSNLRRQAPPLADDLIPLPKPLSAMSDEERLDYAIRLSQLLS